MLWLIKLHYGIFTTCKRVFPHILLVYYILTYWSQIVFSGLYYVYSTIIELLKIPVQLSS